LTVLFTPAPRFVGVDHGSDVLARVEVQRSRRPIPPGRFESKKSSRPSRRTFGRKSSSAELRAVAATGAPNDAPSNGLT
jgi:hypothetical protein